MTDDLRTDVLARGYQTFMGLRLMVAPGVLIPREETELVGTTALDAIRSIPNPRIIDMCCGSGNLACALADALPASRVWAADASPECVRLTRANVAGLGLDARVEVIESDLFEGLRGRSLENAVDLVVCNPPYISSKRLDSGSSWLLDNEPRQAFDGGPYGINIMSRLVRTAPAFVRAGGYLAFEFGEGQHPLVTRMFASESAWHGLQLISNSAGVPRVAIAHRTPLE